jgi:TonB family protein
MGILEVFSAIPGAFSESDERLLQGFAEECARIRLVATELTWHKPAADSASALDANDYLPPPLLHSKSAVSNAVVASGEAEFVASVPAPIAPELLAPENPGPETFTPDLITSLSAEIQQGSNQTIPVPLRATSRRPRYEGWSLVLGGLAIAIAIAVSFLIGSRIGWLRRSTLGPSSPPPSSAANTNPCRPGEPGCQGEQTGTGTDRVKGNRPPSEKTLPRTADRTTQKPKDKSTAAESPGELVVYEKGKVVFRMKPAPVKEAGTTEKPESNPVDSAPVKGATRESANGIVAASSTTKMASFQSVWLSPEEAEGRLLTRVEPKFPVEALNSRRSGTVVLEVQVAEDGSISNVRTLSGDPLLANAATDAVRKWRYQPYRQHDRPSQFQTHVSLNFMLPN